MSWVGWASTESLFTCEFWGYLKLWAEKAKAPAWNWQPVEGGCLSATAAAGAGDEHQGRIHPATVALRPALQTTFGSDMGILECGNKTRPNIERTSGMGAFKPSSVLHSACQHTSLTFNVKSKQMCLWAGWLSSIRFFFPSLNMLIMVYPKILINVRILSKYFCNLENLMRTVWFFSKHLKGLCLLHLNIYMQPAALSPFPNVPKVLLYTTLFLSFTISLPFRISVQSRWQFSSPRWGHYLLYLE